uniref:Uncharacterized protein n=1 Tax=Oryza brachyantha TaxID=4533 RepID=J3LE94_ORYBR
MRVSICARTRALILQDGYDGDVDQNAGELGEGAQQGHEGRGGDRRRLRRKVGHADIVELRTLHDYRGSAGAGATTSGRAGTGYCYSQLSSSGGRSGGGHYYSGSYSPYYHQQQPAAAQHPYDGYYPSPYATTVVQHEYYPTSSDDPSGCSIM